MLKYFIAIFIFCLVLFLYLHIQYHLKTSNDLEVYTIEKPSKETLEEICNIRQPVVFEFKNNRLLESCNLANLDDNYGAFDIQVRDVTNKDDNSELYLPFLLKEAINIFGDDKNEKYISEKNQDFLKETGAIKNYNYNDAFLRPPLVSKCIYDFMTGSVGSKTPLRYNINYRNFYYNTSGRINIKLIPPSSSKYLNPVKDYDNFEFRSPVNVWNVQQEYKADFDKVKVLDVTLNKGEIIFIPAYWWYSIEYETVSSICAFKYRTFMNSLAISPEIVLYMLQGQNIKRDTVNKVDMTDKKEENIKDENSKEKDKED
jgi:hypothetical protein|tara:strand:- start:947 stop:1891 length:945 start_codon:yes stop_codon:yes gene_type:complete